MTNYVRLFITAMISIGLSCASSQALADLFEVHYDGIITSSSSYAGSDINNSNLFDTGSRIAGTLTIDSHSASADLDPNPRVGAYYNFGGPDFVTGYAMPGVVEDAVYVEDAFSGSQDYLWLRDASSFANSNPGFASAYHYIILWAHDSVTDFISGDGLNQAFDLTASDASIGGYLFSYDYRVRNNGIATQTYAYAGFDLSRLSIRAVPAPGTIFLLLFGLLCLMVPPQRSKSHRADDIS